jgi:hypothetical protein
MVHVCQEEITQRATKYLFFLNRNKKTERQVESITEDWNMHVPINKHMHFTCDLFR